MRNWKIPLLGAILGAVVAACGYGLEGLDPLAYVLFGVGLLACFAWRVHSRRRHEARMKALWQRYMELAKEEAELKAGNA